MAIDSTTPASPGSGLKTALDTIVAPNEAFSELRVSPTWLWAFVISAILMIAGYILERPATVHASIGMIQHMLATSPFMTNLSEAQRATMLAGAAHPTALAAALGAIQLLAVSLIAALLNAVFLLAGNAVGRGTGTFKSLWCGSVHITIPTFGLMTLITGIITMAVGADHYNSINDLLGAIPNLGMLAPGLAGLGGSFLHTINVFVLWGLALNIVMMRATARVSGPVAWIAPLLITLVGALSSAAFAHAFGG